MKKTLYCVIMLCFYGLYSVSLYSQEWKTYKDSALYYMNTLDYKNAAENLVKLKSFNIDSNWYFSTIDLGITYWRLQKYDNVEPLLNEGLNRLETKGDTNGFAYVMPLDCLGEYFYLYKHDLSKAEQIFSKIIRIREINNIVFDPQYYSAKNNLADIYRKKGLLDSAIEIYQDIENKFETVDFTDTNNIKFSIYICPTLESMADMYRDVGKIELAKTYIMKAISIIEKAYGINSELYFDAKEQLSNLYINAGEYFKATEIYLDCSNIVSANYGDSNSRYLSLQSDLGNCYHLCGQNSKAIDILIKTLALQKNKIGTNYEDYVLTLSHISSVYYQMGDLKKAEDFNIMAINTLELFNEKSDKLIYLSNSLCDIYTRTNRFIEAQLLYQKSLKILRYENAENSTNYANILCSLGLLNKQIGNFTESEKYYKESINIIEKTQGKDVEYADVLANLSSLYSTEKKYKLAEEESLECLRIMQESFGINSITYYSYLYFIATLYMERNNFKLAENFEIKQINWIKGYLKEHFYEMDFKNQIDFTNQFNQSYEQLNRLILESTDDGFNQQSLLGLSYNNEIRNKEMVLRNFEEIKRNILKSNDSNLVNQYKTLVSLTKQIERYYSKSGKSDSIAFQTNIKKRYELEEAIIRKSKLLSDTKKLFDFDWHDIQKSLTKDDAVIEEYKLSLNDKQDSIFCLYSSLLLLPGHNELQNIYLFTEDNIIDSILNKSTKEDKDYVYEIYYYAKYKTNWYDYFWKRLDSSLNDIKNIYIAPTGILNNINLSAIPIDSNTTFGEKYNVHYLSTTADVINYKSTYLSQKSIQTAIVYGGIDYDKSNNSSNKTEENKDPIGYGQVAEIASRSAVAKFGDLPGTKEETKNIQQLCKANHIKIISFNGANATEASFKQLSGKKEPYILHIATHGYFFPDPEKKKQENQLQHFSEPDKRNVFKWSDDPLLRSGLIFAGANKAWGNPDYVSNDSTEDGILTSYEISNLDLSNCQLVVLSACETGLGDIKGSEGVFGLQRAFKMAGVKNIIMSLWKVPDAQTSELMTLFYNYCFAGKNVHDALQSAQTDMKNKGYKPYYWAAFKLLE